MNAGALAARKILHRQGQLLGTKEKALGPGGDVERPAEVDDGIAGRRERATQRQRWVETGTVLVEVRDAEVVGVPHGTAIGRERPREQPKEGRLPAAVRTEESEAHPGAEDEIERVDDA